MPVQESLQIPLLGGTERMVEHDDVGVERVSRLLEFFRLAGTDEQRRVGTRAFARQCMHRQRSGRGGQQRQFGQAFLEIMLAEIHAHQDGARRIGIGGSSGLQAGGREAPEGETVVNTMAGCGNVSRRMAPSAWDGTEEGRHGAAAASRYGRQRERKYQPSGEASTRKLTARAGTTVEIACL
ncbi:hypothetical protein D3C85_1356260 [compost metagenome]